jgi:hypothetical protein
MASRALPAVAALLVTCFVASGVRAEPTPVELETARSLMDQGYDLRDKGNDKEALKRFQAANDIVNVPTTALEVARTQVALGLLVEARDTLAALRKLRSKANDPAPFKEARKKGEELDASLAQRIPALTVVLRGVPEGEAPAITIDGTAIAPDALGAPRSVNAGHHVVAGRTSAMEATQEVDLREGEKKEVTLTFVANASAGPAIAPDASTRGAPGQAPEQPPVARSHGFDTLTWVGVGVGGAGVIAGTITGVMSLSKTSSLSNDCPGYVCPPSAHGEHDSASTLATVSTVSFIVAGAGAALAVVSLVAGHDEPTAASAQPSTASHTRVVPWLGLGAAGIRGTF